MRQKRAGQLRFYSTPKQQKNVTAALNSKKYYVGEMYHGFVCEDVQVINEYNMTAMLFKHEKTQAKYLHIDRDDPNNVFSIGFRTTPFDSRGTPHILEHTVLCGSEKYPIRDPFFKMLNRSLATFMNALTGPDYTFYPFSSQNDSDYRNLQKVYMDAVLKPNLNYLDFLQEGWRMENTELNNRDSDICFKGVVYNEMKGAFSETGSLFGQKFINSILPQGSYGFVSGGDPLEIPRLTYKDLKEFHGKYYHPSNARFYSYGNFPLEKNLSFCNENYLQNYTYLDPEHSVVKPQERWLVPRYKKINCRFDEYGQPIEKQNQIAIGHVMADITDINETFILATLSQLMLVGPNSAFYKSLIESNISGGYNMLTGYDNQFRDTLFTVGLKDLEVEKFEEVQQIFDETIHNIIETGFKKEHVNSVIHSYELSVKHQSPKFGLNLLFNMLPLWNHDGPIVEAMHVNKMLSSLKDNVRKDKFLNKAVEKYFANNNHRLVMTMQPDPQFESKFNQSEKRLLESMVKDLSNEKRDEIYEKGLQLSEAQKKIENLDILPCLKIDEIKLMKKKPKLEQFYAGPVPIQLCEANTNGITYFKGVLNTTHLTNEQELLLPFFNSVVDKFDTKNYNYRDFDTLVSQKTGGLSFSMQIVEKISEPSKFERGIVLGSHCLDENLTSMSEIWHEIFSKPKFTNKPRLDMLLNNYLSSLTEGIIDSGHVYAIQAANSLVSTIGVMREQFSGIEHIKIMQNIAMKHGAEYILAIADIIAQNLLLEKHLRVAVNFSSSPGSDSREKVLNFCNGFAKSSPLKTDKNQVIWMDCKDLGKKNRGLHIKMNVPINYCAKAIPTVPYVHRDFAKLRVLSRFLTSKYLHPVVREQNGAYGGGSSISTEGVFNFYSYRDPNSKITLDVFDGCNEWLQDNSALVTEQALFEAKLGVLQQIDAPVSEFLKGIDYFLHGVSYEMWTIQRQRILDVTKEDLLAVSRKYLNEDRWYGKCVLGQGLANMANEGEDWEVTNGPQQ